MSTNSGNRNSGNGNSGYRNSGSGNSGNGNSGNRNSGSGNSGNGNSGNRNSGSGNSGDFNSGNGNSGYFNTDEPTIRLFNRDSGKYRRELDLPNIWPILNEWVSSENMTDAEKLANPSHTITDGYLRTITYKEAWAKAWANAPQSEKDKLFALPNFDAAIFEEITGIKIETVEHSTSLDEIRQVLAKYGYDIIKKV